MPTDEETGLKANLLKDHMKEKAKDKFTKLSTMAHDSGSEVKRVTSEAVYKTVDKVSIFFTSDKYI